MAKEFAKPFYRSKKWKAARELCISKNHGICEICGKSFPSRSLIVHHKIHLTPENIDNVDISLNQDNLQCICWSCHNEIHMSKQHKDMNREMAFDSDGNIIDVNDKE